MSESALIDVRAYGRGESTVAVLHGGPGAPGSVSDLASELGRDFGVIEPLQRRSGAIPLSVERHVLDLAEVAPPLVALVGWSWGAMLALSFAARFPERASAIVLVGCGTYDAFGRAQYVEAMQRRLSTTGQGRMGSLRARIEDSPDSSERDRLLGEIGSLATSAMSYDESVADPNALPADERGHDETWQDALQLQREGIEPSRFTAITSPVLMLHGADDPHPGPATRDALRPFVPQLEYVEFERCGHAPWRERHARAAFLATLRNWLNDRTGG